MRHIAYTASMTGRRTLLALLLLGALALAGLAPAQAQDDEAFGVIAVLWPTPNVQTTPGSVISYEIQAKNFRRAGLSSVRVHMPYDPAQLTIVGADATPNQDWLSELGSDYVVVMFGEMQGGETRSVTVHAQVNPALPPGTVISMWAGYSWTGPGGTVGPRGSNAAPVLVGESVEASAYTWMTVYPERAPASEPQVFFSDRFVPGEQIETWLLTPEGQQPLALTARVDAQGRFGIEVPAGRFAPGSYQIVAHGLRSNLQATARFIVDE